MGFSIGRPIQSVLVPEQQNQNVESAAQNRAVKETTAPLNESAKKTAETPSLPKLQNELRSPASETFLQGNLLSARLNSQLLGAQNIQSVELRNVAGLIQGNSLTLTGDFGSQAKLFMDAALQGKTIPSLTLELPLMDESGHSMGIQTVRLTNVMVPSFQTIDGLISPQQEINLQFEQLAELLKAEKEE